MSLAFGWYVFIGSVILSGIALYMEHECMKNIRKQKKQRRSVRR